MCRYAFDLDSRLDGIAQFGKNGAIIGAEDRRLKEITKNGVGAIGDPGIRSAFSTAGSIGELVAGLVYGIGSGLCARMGWEQKASICLHGVGICAIIASSMNEADPINPATVTGKLAGAAVGKMSA